MTKRCLALSCLWIAGLEVETARANVNLELRGMPSSACSGEVFDIDLYAVSDNASNQTLGGAEVLLVWDPLRLKLLGHVDTGPYLWVGSFFPNDSQGDGLNEPFTGPAPFVPDNDGDAIYSVFGQFAPNPPAAATPAGLLVTTFQFEALRPGDVDLSVPSQYAANSETRIVDGIEPGVLVTGTLPVASTTVLCPPVQVQEGGPRWFAVTAPSCPAQVALRISGLEGDPAEECFVRYVQANGNTGPSPVFKTPQEWATIVVQGTAIVPDTQYEIYSDCGDALVPGLSDPVSVRTWDWADVNDTGLVDVDDIVAMMLAFAGFLNDTPAATFDLYPCVPNDVIDSDDIIAVLDAFQSIPLSTNCPPPCP